MRFCWNLVRCRPSKALALGGRRWDLRWTVCAGGEGGLDHVDIWEIVLVIKLLEQLLNLRFTFQMSGLRVLLWVLWKQGSEARFSWTWSKWVALQVRCDAAQLLKPEQEQALWLLVLLLKRPDISRFNQDSSWLHENMKWRTLKMWNLRTQVQHVVQQSHYSWLHLILRG